MIPSIHSVLVSIWPFDGRDSRSDVIWIVAWRAEARECIGRWDADSKHNGEELSMMSDTTVVRREEASETGRTVIEDNTKQAR